MNVLAAKVFLNLKGWNALIQCLNYLIWNILYRLHWFSLNIQVRFSASYKLNNIWIRFYNRSDDRRSCLNSKPYCINDGLFIKSFICFYKTMVAVSIDIRYANSLALCYQWSVITWNLPLLKLDFWRKHLLYI